MPNSFPTNRRNATILNIEYQSQLTALAKANKSKEFGVSDALQNMGLTGFEIGSKKAAAKKPENLISMMQAENCEKRSILQRKPTETSLPLSSPANSKK